MEKAVQIAVNTPAFKFDLNQMVNIRVSDEFGEVRGRAQYANAENQYYIHYRAADGRATSSWFDESLLVAAEDDRHPGCPIYGCTELPEGVTVEDE
ncbi:hypothetical protein [Edwardsiella anguillarum]|uniref:Phage protein n=1 Tax=Edwardsiella anguillarum TaxID=1821960 RepID=A0ABY8SHQ9_9GAMM|nr:hypothetical protein [Edwardsiella anguillarum]WHP85190.1 hypothetical protein MQ095_07160 [Edwardsiella anguillarum]WHP88972.1 hypothetical protein MQ088_07165 [Edwardsiella anguillarum]WHP92772.1 hypothetical protein MQ091_07160 [Edwardsiella anguillarum]WHP96577.1 hypothetical protein MQ096_07155 [Edwardsiella anguillarum]WHQ00448.1 hypothetical protein MQ082_07160 [Edwardsiella anguillarum]